VWTANRNTYNVLNYVIPLRFTGVQNKGYRRIYSIEGHAVIKCNTNTKPTW
jgi:hypothetical protein